MTLPESVFLRYGVDYLDQPVVLNVTALGFGDVGRTHNEKEVGRVLDEPPLEHPLVKAIYSADTEGQARFWLNQLSGEIYTAYPLVDAAGIESFGRAVDRGLGNSDPDEDRRWWLSVYQDSGEIRGNEENASGHFKVRGAVLGVDVLTGAKGRIGITAATANALVRMGDRGNDMKGAGHHVGMYGEYKAGAFRWSSVAAYGKNVYNSERRISVGNGADVFERTASGQFNGHQWLVTARGERFGVRDATVLEPVFGLSWLSVARGAFAESGADEGNLALDRYSTNYVRGDLGLRLRLQPAATRNGGMVQRTLWAAYVHDRQGRNNLGSPVFSVQSSCGLEESS